MDKASRWESSSAIYWYDLTQFDHIHYTELEQTRSPTERLTAGTLLILEGDQGQYYD